MNLCNHAGDTALHVLVAEGPLGTEAMQLLLGAGADPNIMNATGELPAHGFSRRVSRDAPILLKIILEAGNGRVFRRAVYGNDTRAMNTATKQSLNLHRIFDAIEASILCPISVAKQTATALDVLSKRATPSTSCVQNSSDGMAPTAVIGGETALPAFSAAVIQKLNLSPLPIMATAIAAENAESAEMTAKTSAYVRDLRWPLLHCICGSAVYEMATAAEPGGEVEPFDSMAVLCASRGGSSFAALLRAALKRLNGGPSSLSPSWSNGGVKGMLPHGMPLPSSGLTPMHTIVRVFSSSIAVCMLQLLFDYGADPNTLADVSLVRNWVTSLGAAAAEAAPQAKRHGYHQLQRATARTHQQQYRFQNNISRKLLPSQDRTVSAMHPNGSHFQQMGIVAPILSVALAHPHSQATARWLLSTVAPTATSSSFLSSSCRQFVDPCPPTADPSPLHIACSSRSSPATVLALLQSPRGRSALALHCYSAPTATVVGFKEAKNGHAGGNGYGSMSDNINIKLHGSTFRRFDTLHDVPAGTGPRITKVLVEGTALHAAAAAGDEKLVQVLLNFAADDEILRGSRLDRWGRKFGTVRGKSGVLLDVSARDSAGRSALHVAVLCRHFNAAAALLDYVMKTRHAVDMAKRRSLEGVTASNESINSFFEVDLATAPDAGGKPPLQLAIDAAAPDIVRLLVETHPSIAAAVAERPFAGHGYEDHGGDAGTIAKKILLDVHTAAPNEECSAFKWFAASPEDESSSNESVGLDSKERRVLRPPPPAGNTPKIHRTESGGDVVEEAEIRYWQNTHPLLYAEQVQAHFLSPPNEPPRSACEKASTSELLSGRHQPMTTDEQLECSRGRKSDYASNRGEEGTHMPARRGGREGRGNSQANIGISDSSTGASDSTVSNANNNASHEPKSPLKSAFVSAPVVTAISAAAGTTTPKKEKRRSIVKIDGKHNRNGRSGARKKERKAPVDYFEWRRAFRAEFALLSCPHIVKIDEIICYLFQATVQCSHGALPPPLIPSPFDGDLRAGRYSSSPRCLRPPSPKATLVVPCLALPGLKDLPGLSDNGILEPQLSAAQSTGSRERNTAESATSRSAAMQHQCGGKDIEERDKFEDKEGIATKKKVADVALQAAVADKAKNAMQVEAKWRACLAGLPHIAPCFSEGVTLLQKRWAELGPTAAILVQAAARRFLGRCRYLQVRECVVSPQSALFVLWLLLAHIERPILQRRYRGEFIARHNLSGESRSQLCGLLLLQLEQSPARGSK